VSHLGTNVFGGSVYLWPNNSGEPRFDYEKTCLGRSTTTLGRSVRTSTPHSLARKECSSQYSTRAIQNGANALAEGFLFSVAASLILAETYRSSRSNSKRREDVDDRIEDLEERLAKAHAIIQRLEEKIIIVAEQEDIESAKFVPWPIYLSLDLRVGLFAPRNQELSKVLTRIVDIGLRGGWAEFEDKPVSIPQGAHLQGSSHTSRVSPGAPVTNEASSRSASASPNLAAAVDQGNKQPASPPTNKQPSSSSP
jgi:optic atrophy 3 protein